MVPSCRYCTSIDLKSSQSEKLNFKNPERFWMKTTCKEHVQGTEKFVKELATADLMFLLSEVILHSTSKEVNFDHSDVCHTITREFYKYMIYKEYLYSVSVYQKYLTRFGE